MIRNTAHSRVRLALALALAVSAWVTNAGAQPAPNVQGLWWAAPAGSESGWGINFAHHGDQVFATWFTYDTAGRASWLSMTAQRSAERTYTGELLRTEGPPFGAQPFDPASVQRTPGGTATLRFTDANRATLSYVVDGVAQAKPLVRQAFGPAPACIQMPQPDLAQADNMQDLWWVANGVESGWGINFAHQGDTIFATWFTYDVDRRPLWLSATTVRQGTSNVWRGDVVRTSGARFDAFDPALVQRRIVGTATITFADGNHATFAYAIADAALGGPLAQAKAIVRQPFGGGDPTVCYAIPDFAYPVSDASPLAAGCDGVLPSGTLYVGAEVEPHIAVDPRDPSHLVGAWQQDRWSNGGARGLVGAASFDGGRTWTGSAAPFSRCTGGTAANGGDYERVSDPWVSIGPDGTVYQVALANNAGRNNGILASRSVDGGLTWSAPATLIADGPDMFNDKESVTADPHAAGFAYAVWDRLADTGRGPTYFARTTDAGRTWEPARPIYDPGGRNQTINNQVVVLPDGTLVAFFTAFDVAADNRATARLALVRSGDKGATWSAPVDVAPVQALGASDPETGTALREGVNLGAIAVGPDGSLVVAWQDARFSGGTRDGIALSRSTNGGLAWSTPVRVNRDASVQAFLPGVAIAADGTIGVTYYDFRTNTADPSTLFTDYWLARSADGGATWRESRVAGPFDLSTAPFANGLFLGDYQGLVAAGSTFVPFYATVNTGDLANRTNVFASRVPVALQAGTARATGLSPAHPVPDAYAGVASEPLPLTPALAQKLSDSATRALARRDRGMREPTGAGPPE